MVQHNRMVLRLFEFFLLFILSIPSPVKSAENQEGKIDSQPQFKQLTINLISWKNGVGLNQDVDILDSELTKLGHFVRFIDVRDLQPQLKADINIFIEVKDEFFFPFATLNYLLPNPEWCHSPAHELSQYDVILCKTKEAERIFKTLNPNTVFLGFTSKDRLDETISKDYKSPLHLAGASIQKGTDVLIKTWMGNPQFPTLFMIRHKSKPVDPPLSNFFLISDYLTDSALKMFQNNCGLHICPSETEGFGHYIMEALSCGAVVVTTDAPPMNEFVLDKRCLVGYHRTEPWRWAMNYYVDPQKLENVIATLLSLPVEELKEIGRKNREFYLENDRMFKQRFAEIFNANISLEHKSDLAERVFTSIYHNKLWGENPSGEGALPEYTKIYRYFLQNFFKDHHIQNVIEIGCGDWQFSRHMDWTGIQYTGYDVFKEVVEKNQAQFSSSSIKFIHGNVLRENLPEADLLLCKDVLQHLPNEEILSLLSQLKKFKHCLIVNDVDPDSLTGNNWNIPLGGLRDLDLTKSPFNIKGKKILTFVCGGVTKQVLYIKNESF
jgi:glycosyltransferase involved in cell wall biosynthesis